MHDYPVDFFSCSDDATFPSFSNIKSLKFIVSHRISHELTTRAVAMFLREIMDFDKPIYFEVYDEDHWREAFLGNNEYYEDDKTIDTYSFFELMNDVSAVNLAVWQTSEHRDFVIDKTQASDEPEGFRFLNPFKDYWV